jgi:glycosyltransferase involved in cell wall biosynthesis
MTVGLSVIVIAQDEEASIAATLRSVSWADEIVVVDSGSTDRTVAICRELGARVVTTADWPGFGAQKNRALAEARGDWVLSLDADEQVTPQLREEIAQAIAAPAAHDAYALHAPWRLVARLRDAPLSPRQGALFRRPGAREARRGRHDRKAREPSGAPRVRESRGSPAQGGPVLERQRAHAARARPQGLAHEGDPDGAWAFIRTYVLRAGFLDGRHGFMLAVSNAEGTYYRYLKLMLLDDQR